MTRVVISQPMLFPWVGLLEQVRLADVYVHYDDVQFSKGSFTNRVQIKTAAGSKWLTIPLGGLKLGQTIREVKAGGVDWRASHIALLAQSYAGSHYSAEMLALVEDVYSRSIDSVSTIAIHSLEAVWKYFDLTPGDIRYSSQMGINGSGSERVLDVVRSVGGDVYITGHGAKQYLDHEQFERQSVRVEYVDYQRIQYVQLHGEFTPYVSSLDLIANCGRDGRSVIRSGTKYWREFLI